MGLRPFKIDLIPWLLKRWKDREKGGGGGGTSMEAIKEKEIQNRKNKIFGAINNQYDHKSFM